MAPPLTTRTMGLPFVTRLTLATGGMFPGPVLVGADFMVPTKLFHAKTSLKPRRQNARRTGAGCASALLNIYIPVPKRNIPRPVWASILQHCTGETGYRHVCKNRWLDFADRSALALAVVSALSHYPILDIGAGVGTSCGMRAERAAGGADG